MKWLRNKEVEELKERLDYAEKLLDMAIDLANAVDHNPAHAEQAQDLLDAIAHRRRLNRMYGHND